MKKIVFFVIVIIFAIVLFAVVAIGFNKTKNPFEISMTSDKTEARRGETIKITVAINNILDNDGIWAISGKLQYDTAVFEKIQADDGISDNIESAKEWGTVIFNDGSQKKENEGLFVVETSADYGVKEDNEIMYISFKILDTAQLGNSVIKITNISGTNGNEDIETKEADIKIKIKE
ncbi:MAG: hypothetical protein IKP28_06735 [Clostridia bacterium]|nr:hypothetical protein [Clostridia bacterium]